MKSSKWAQEQQRPALTSSPSRTPPDDVVVTPLRCSPPLMVCSNTPSPRSSKRAVVVSSSSGSSSSSSTSSNFHHVASPTQPRQRTRTMEDATATGIPPPEGGVLVPPSLLPPSSLSPPQQQQQQYWTTKSPSPSVSTDNDVSSGLSMMMIMPRLRSFFWQRNSVRSWIRPRRSSLTTMGRTLFIVVVITFIIMTMIILLADPFQVVSPSVEDFTNTIPAQRTALSGLLAFRSDPYASSSSRSNRIQQQERFLRRRPPQNGPAHWDVTSRQEQKRLILPSWIWVKDPSPSLFYRVVLPPTTTITSAAETPTTTIATIALATNSAPSVPAAAAVDANQQKLFMSSPIRLNEDAMTTTTTTSATTTTATRSATTSTRSNVRGSPPWHFWPARRAPSFPNNWPNNGGTNQNRKAKNSRAAPSSSSLRSLWTFRKNTADTQGIKEISNPPPHPSLSNIPRALPLDLDLRHYRLDNYDESLYQYYTGFDGSIKHHWFWNMTFLGSLGWSETCWGKNIFVGVLVLILLVFLLRTLLLQVWRRKACQEASSSSSADSLQQQQRATTKQ